MKEREPSGVETLLPPREKQPHGRFRLLLLLLAVLLLFLVNDLGFYKFTTPFLPSNVITFVEAKTAIYRGSVYRGVSEEDLEEGGLNFSVELSIPAFPTNNYSELFRVTSEILTTNVRLVNENGVVLNSTVFWSGPNGPIAPPMDRNRTNNGQDITTVIENTLKHSVVEVTPDGKKIVVKFGRLSASEWAWSDATATLVVPCVPLSLFVGLSQIVVEDMPLNCLAGDPFMIHKKALARLDVARWNAMNHFFVTASPIEVPLRSGTARPLDKFTMEHNLRVMEGTSCLHTRPAFVRGSLWDIHDEVYRFTPHRGGVQTLCYTPYPDTLPLLRLKLMDSYEVAGPEGVSTEPAQVRAELEFTGTIYGTNLTERDTVVITDELCADFTSQNVFFVELFFSSASRVSFFGTFHKRGIFHVCYHREGSPSYVRVSTLLVERGTEVVIENDSANVLIDQDVKLQQSASVTRLKVQNKGNLDLKKRTLNVSYLLWSGGSISGKGLINCTGYAKITTQGYETRQLLVPIHNYGEMTIDVQRLSLEQEGAIYNYGNLTIAVPSMGEDGISSVLSQGKRNAIYNMGRGLLRIVAIERQSYALLTNRFSFQNGLVLILGKISMTDVTASSRSTISIQAASQVALYNAHLAGGIHTEENSMVRIMEGGSLVSLAIAGTGTVVIGGDSMLDSVNVVGEMTVVFGEVDSNPTSVTIYGTITFGSLVFVHFVNVHFFSTGVAKLFSYGTVLMDYERSGFSGNMVIQTSGVSVIHGALSTASPVKSNHLGSLLAPPESTFFIIDSSPPNTSAALPVLMTLSGNSTSDGSSTNESVSSLGSDPSTTAGVATGSHCQNAFRVAEFITLSGRLLLHGCLSIPVGGFLSGWVGLMQDAKDWQALREKVCHNFLLSPPSFCSPSFPIHTPVYSGLTLSGEMQIRRTSHVELDELRLVGAKVRAEDTVSLTLHRGMYVDGMSFLTFLEGANISAPLIEVEGGGSLTFEALPETFIKGNLSVLPQGVLQLVSNTANCQSELNISGTVEVSTGGTVRCSGLPKTHMSPDDDDDVKSTGRLGGLPPGIECPPSIVKDYEKRRHVLALFWMKDDLMFSAEEAELPTSLVIRGVVVSLIFFFVLFFGFLHLRGSTFAQWRDDLLMPSPLKLTLTWYELSYSTMNYVSFCAVALAYVQNTMVAFHPKMPAPLPLVGMLCVRSVGVLMPHRVAQLQHANIGCLLIILVSAVTFAVGQRPVKRRQKLLNWHSQTVQYVLETLESGTIFVIGILSLFHIPISSFVVDGIACSTLLSDVPSCREFNNTTTFILSFAAFLSVVVLEPFTVSTMQMRMSRVDLKIKSVWVFLMHNVSILEILLWKVFYGSATKTALCIGTFHLLYLLLSWLSPPTAYMNINHFLLHVRILSLIVIATILFHEARASMGKISTCTDGELLFKGVFAATAIGTFVSFWNNILYAHAPNESVGDASIDALRRSLAQIRSRIADLKMEVFASADATDRENTLNAIARLRIEFLEKQERYRYETHRLLRIFYVGSQGAEADTASVGPSSLLTHSGEDFVSSGSMTSHTQASTHNLLTAEEMENFSCGPALGKGSYGTVHLGILSNGRLVAVKYVNVVNENPEVLDNVKAEVDVLKQLSHPNIIRYYGAHMIGDTMLVFMEFAVGGSLTSILRKFSELTEPVMQLYTYQILRGLQYLHYKGVVHRDIKGENILIDGLGVAKLADFGCSKSLANVANGSHVGCGTLVGSPFWMAPEVIRSEAYGTKADIWSVGCTVVEMLNRGEPPWREEFDNVYSAMFYVGSTNDIPQIPEETSDVCRDFLYHCFERDVAKRATADELLRHPWLAAVAASRTDESVSDLTSFASEYLGSPLTQMDYFSPSSPTSTKTEPRVAETRGHNGHTSKNFSHVGSSLDGLAANTPSDDGSQAVYTTAADRSRRTKDTDSISSQQTMSRQVTTSSRSDPFAHSTPEMPPKKSQQEMPSVSLSDDEAQEREDEEKKDE